LRGWLMDNGTRTRLENQKTGCKCPEQIMKKRQWKDSL
jgi:hypothetical protein